MEEDVLAELCQAAKVAVGELSFESAVRRRVSMEEALVGQMAKNSGKAPAPREAHAHLVFSVVANCAKEEENAVPMGLSSLFVSAKLLGERWGLR